MNILTILQARVSSSRLPGKVLKPILGMPMLLRQIERIRRAKRITHLIVATSTNSSDDSIETMCLQSNIECFRGDLKDVLNRYYQAAKPYNPDYIVRLTGDCPLIDPEVIDRVVSFCLDGNYDHASNGGEVSFPDGLDVEMFRFSALEAAWHEARLPSEREHVTPFIYNHPERFKTAQYKNSVNLSHLRWTVDEPADFELVRIIYESLYPSKADFLTSDILALIEKRPELATMNTQHSRNEGYAKSLLEDKAFLDKQAPHR